MIFFDNVKYRLYCKEENKEKTRINKLVTLNNKTLRIIQNKPKPYNSPESFIQPLKIYLQSAEYVCSNVFCVIL